MMNVEIGHIIRIENEDSEQIDGIILFLSDYFEDLMLLGMPFNTNEKALQISDLLESIELLIYTGKQSVVEGPWKVVGRVDVSDCTCLSERIDGDSIWIGDQKVRKKNQSDIGAVPLMRVAGEGAVENIVSQLKGSIPMSKFTTSSIKSSKALFNRIKKSEKL